MDGDIREDEEDEFREWVIEWIGADVSILGPGQLGIRLRRKMTQRIACVLRTQRDRGTTRCEEGSGQYFLWQIVK